MLAVAPTACGTVVVFSNESAVVEAQICGDNGVTTAASVPGSRLQRRWRVLLPWMVREESMAGAVKMMEDDGSDVVAGT